MPQTAEQQDLPLEQSELYAELCALPENRVGEIINGRLISHPRPAPKHALASSFLGGELDTPFNKGRGGPGGWIILFEPELHIHGHALVPDLAGWRRERLPALPDTAYFETAPDWVCEVLSPSTAQDDRVDKMPIYAGMSVAHCWLIDPEARTLEVYSLQENGHWLLEHSYKNADEVCAPPFEALTFDLGVLWPD